MISRNYIIFSQWIKGQFIGITRCFDWSQKYYRRPCIKRGITSLIIIKIFLILIVLRLLPFVSYFAFTMISWEWYSHWNLDSETGLSVAVHKHQNNSMPSWKFKLLNTFYSVWWKAMSLITKWPKKSQTFPKLSILSVQLVNFMKDLHKLLDILVFS